MSLKKRDREALSYVRGLVGRFRPGLTVHHETAASAYGYSLPRDRPYQEGILCIHTIMLAHPCTLGEGCPPCPYEFLSHFIRRKS